LELYKCFDVSVGPECDRKTDAFILSFTL